MFLISTVHPSFSNSTAIYAPIATGKLSNLQALGEFHHFFARLAVRLIGYENVNEKSRSVLGRLTQVNDVGTYDIVCVQLYTSPSLYCKLCSYQTEPDIFSPWSDIVIISSWKHVRREEQQKLKNKSTAQKTASALVTNFGYFYSTLVST